MLPADLRNYRAHARNERALDWLESALGIATGCALVYLVAVLVLSLT